MNDSELKSILRSADPETPTIDHRAIAAAMVAQAEKHDQSVSLAASNSSTRNAQRIATALSLLSLSPILLLAVAWMFSDSTNQSDSPELALGPVVNLNNDDLEMNSVGPESDEDAMEHRNSQMSELRTAAPVKEFQLEVQGYRSRVRASEALFLAIEAGSPIGPEKIIAMYPDTPAADRCRLMLDSRSPAGSF